MLSKEEKHIFATIVTAAQTGRLVLLPTKKKHTADSDESSATTIAFIGAVIDDGDEDAKVLPLAALFTDSDRELLLAPAADTAGVMSGPPASRKNLDEAAAAYEAAKKGEGHA